MKIKCPVFLVHFFIFYILLSSILLGATKTSALSGTWNNPATWGGATPVSGDVIIIASPHTVTLDVAATIASLTINSGGTFNGGTGLNTLTVNAAGTITNNGTYTGNTETVSFSGAGTINGTTAILFNNVTLNGALTLSTIPTFNGTLQINAGGNLSAAPNYGASSTLLYNATYTRFNEWTTATSGAGYPANVQISNNSTFTFKPAGGGLGQCSGNLTIDAGSTFTMSNMTTSLTVLGNLNCNGTIQLGTASGGDLRIGGNMTRSAASTWTNNLRDLMFMGSGAQTITYTGGGTWQIDYFTINKPSGNVVLSSSPATNVQLVQTSGNIFTINNAGGLDLNGQTLTLGCAGCMGGSILIDATGGATKSIISTIAGGVFRIQGNVTNAVGKTVTNVGTVTLTFSTNAILAINTCQLNPGANLTTVNSELDIESGGDNITNACTYGPSSTLKFKNASVFVLTATQKTWVSGASGVGVPYNVIIDGASVPGSGIRSNISASYYARKDFTITGNGAVDLSATGAPANNLYVAGNWTGSLTELFTPNTNTVIFNGSSAQTLTLTGGSETFYDLEIANTSGDLTLATSSAITLTHRLRFTSGNIIIGNNNFTYNLLSVADAPNATLGTPSNTCKIVTNGTGVVTIKNLPISNTFFFEIGPTTTSYNKVNWETAGAGHTTDDFSARVVVGLPTDILSTAYVNRTWFVSEGVVGGSNGDINFYWQTAHENPSFTSNRASGTTYHKPAATWNTEPNTNLVPLDNNSANMPAAGWRARAGKITSFSPFIEGTSTALPIELISFTGKAIKDGNLLEWQTGSETNNDYFTLEHAVKSLDFKNIGRIKGAGNSVRILNYSFFDNSSEALQSEVSYYKLKQTDFDGKTTYSKEVAINRANKNCFNLTNYFVDENRNMHLTFNAPDSKIITIEVNDALGQVIYTHSFKEAESTIHFDLPEKYAHQLLFLKVSCGQQIAIKKFYY